MSTFFDNMNETVGRFFGTPAFKLARREDPITSHQSAQAVDTTKLEQMVYEAIKSHPEGCISDQVLEKFPQYPYSSITARYKSLLDKGFIEITGTREGRSGRKQRVMRSSK